jgi:hypothetical protein
MGTGGSFSGWNSRCVRLTTHLLPRLRMSGAIPPPLLYLHGVYRNKFTFFLLLILKMYSPLQSLQSILCGFNPFITKLHLTPRRLVSDTASDCMNTHTRARARALTHFMFSQCELLLAVLPLNCGWCVLYGSSVLHVPLASVHLAVVTACKDTIN